ncbi:hypothetical protein C3K47_00125 [Solitalea longa]|uniref:Uncharacterized protein n=1 Tax=Solitalea longa TaxID=2079460 RepID=A0A2S5A8R1_9SPHI|nr:hypothetical protein [Solitalea longa]POY38945.1 hypothetical protein C3K47_00125 [Solitalea longa]
MPTKVELEKRYSSYSNEELLDLLNDQEAYTELAIDVASNELKGRNLGEEEIKEYIAQKYKQAELFIEKNIHQELPLVLKSIFYFCWLPLITLPFKMYFKEDKSILKLKQTNFYATIGFIFFTVAALCFLFLKTNLLSAISIWIMGMIIALITDKRFNRDPIIRRFDQIIRKYQSSSPLFTDNDEPSQLP